MTDKIFYGNGKLFLTGEYLVLDGAIAFAVPTKYGQSLTVEIDASETIKWNSFDADGSLWYADAIPLHDIFQKTRSSNPTTNTLIDILHTAHTMNPSTLQSGCTIETRLTFPRHWGLGSSSTLIYTVAQWFAIDAFELLDKSFGGSGYDIACAGHDHPILYRRDPVRVERIDFDPPFADQLYFVYLNEKRNSKSAIAAYRSRNPETLDEAVRAVDALTLQATQAKTANEFAHILQRHEALLSGLLDETPVQQRLFTDFPGTVKSLGAWGGDFVLAVSSSDPTEYFREKGYETMIPYRNMVK